MIPVGNKALAKGDNPGFYFQVLAENGRFAKLIEELESRWPTLDEFSDNWVGRSGYGNTSMGFIAQAYLKLGQQDKFEDAMSRFKAALDAQIAEGANNWVLTQSEAFYEMLSNDHEEAITLLEKAFQQGLYIDTVAETAWPAAGYPYGVPGGWAI